jgi:xeroderma pigmentosum group C-complementing protein
MPKKREATTLTKMSKADQYRAAMAKYETKQSDNSNSTEFTSPRRRLGHPNAADYQIPSMSSTSSSPDRPSNRSGPKPVRGESAFPVYWVEVLDVAHQKWQPVDALVTNTQWKPKSLEPPAADRSNYMVYAVAMEADGSAKDVTRRYVKAYNSKTRKMRVDGVNPSHGTRWWRRAMLPFTKLWPTDVDQIEDNELALEESREPMPRNVADFKDHPVFALERHLRRHEVLVPDAVPAGTVGAGSRGPLERIYRRQDVRLARSADKWYRLGREVRPGAEPVKIIPKPVRRKSAFADDDVNEDEGTDDPDKVGLFGDAVVGGIPIYMFEQTDPYIPQPVIRGRIPKNKFGNIDVYVPSMVPQGGVHVMHERAARAAFILGIDYAPALTGFNFKGRRGTAVLHGVVVASEYEEAVLTVIVGLDDLDEELEQQRRSLKALRMWSRFLKVLRIRERIWAGAGDDEENQSEEVGLDKGKGLATDEDIDPVDLPSDVSEEYFMDEDEGGGGFLIE